ncbi:MAG: YlbF family regulator [Halanaerobacter sp.]
MSVKEKAEKLAAAIKNSSEFKTFKAAEKQLTEDDEAKDLMQKLQAKQQRVQMIRQSGQELNESMQDDLQSLHDEMQENEIVSNLMEKQEEFNQIMQEVNKILSTAMRGEEN